MFSTTLAAAAVGGLLVSGSLTVPPSWQPDYRAALVQSAEQHKPVAVFIATGGYEKLVQDGRIGLEAVALLRLNYVCVNVDTQTESGKALAESFGLSEGLVISDKSGGLQALRHGGKVSQAELSKYLKSYSEGKTPVSTEVVNNAVVPATTPSTLSSYTAQPYRVCGPNGCQLVYPSSSNYTQPATGPVRQVIGNTVGGIRQVIGGMTGTCATGNCPYR